MGASLPFVCVVEFGAGFTVSKATSANLTRSFRNVPKAATSKSDCTGICHLCLAGRPDFDYEDVYL